MGLNKAIQHKKEKRQPFRGSKVFDCSCRNHGSCAWCRRNRLNKFVKAEREAEAKLKEYEIEQSSANAANQSR